MIEKMIKTYETLNDKEKKTFSLWDLFIKTINKSNFDIWLLDLKANIEIISLLVDGISPTSVARRYNIPTTSVYEICKSWGIRPFSVTLDFSALSFYKPGMTALEMCNLVNIVLSKPLSLNTYRDIIYNLERYYDFIEVLEEYE